MSYLLRHDPEDLTIDSEGWVSFKALQIKIGIEESQMREIISSSSKKRFELKVHDQVEFIRACQGHTNKDVRIGKGGGISIFLVQQSWSSKGLISPLNLLTY